MASDRIDESMQLVEPRWTPGRAARVLEGIDGRRPWRRRTALVLAATAVAGAALLGPRLWRPGWPPPAPAQLAFPDGTTVRATMPATELRVAEDTPARQVVHIVRGGARFDVAHVEGRTFRVQLGDVAVEVLGTLFRVEQLGGGVRVTVERGRVRVLRGGEQREVAAGSSLELAPAAAVIAPPAAARFAAAPPAVAPAKLPVRVVPPPRRVATAAPAREELSPAALLEAADRARRSGHPGGAVTPLRMLVARFPEDGRAPLAAFTLGLLALDRRDPDEAARAFALARRLDPGGELAEDALAREVQAWYEAGREETTRERARQYLELYPTGRRAGSVRRLGGIR